MNHEPIDTALLEGAEALQLNRKRFLRFAGISLAATAIGGSLDTRAQTNADRLRALSPPARVPAEPRQPIELEDWKGAADPKSGPLPTPLPAPQRVGYAVVGLGHLSLGEILPALRQCELSRVVALVSGSPEKMAKVAKQYGVRPESCYSYERFDELAHNREVDAVYIVLPNGLHKEFVVRAARAGKHVLCEKPMANSSAECREMIAACKSAKVKLMVAYRIQYQPHHQKLRELLQSEAFGKVKFVEACNSQSSANPAHWRHNKALAGGGSLPDIGLYCLNTTRYLLGLEPVEVFAYQYSTPGNPLFREVEELMSWQMKFPNGIYAQCVSHYNVHESRRHRVLCEQGWLNMDAAYGYTGQQLSTSRADGTMSRQETLKIPEKNQFGAELDHFSGCILDGSDPKTPGEEGLKDHLVMEAIYRSAKEGRPVVL